MPGLSIGRLILTMLALIVSIVPWWADYNKTHVFNPLWPPHAKFHNAQTLMLATLSGLCALWLLWTPGAAGSDALFRLDIAALFTALYWLTIIPAILVPNTDYVDSAAADHLPRFFGMRLNQTLIGSVWIVLVVLGWWLERGRLA